MAGIPPTYASPGLRWGLALEDHPGAYVEFEEKPGTEVGIPARLGGNDSFCVATVHFPSTIGSTRKPVIGYKAIGSEIKGVLDHASDRWNIVCTKALGRALKRAGYPDDMDDLKALVVWRQREAEIRAIGTGVAQVALAPAQTERALEAAGRQSPEASGPDDGQAPSTEPDESGVTEAESIDGADLTLVPPSDGSRAELRKAINGLGSRSHELTKWAKDNNLRVTRPATEWEARQLIAQAAVISGDGAVEVTQSDGAGDVVDVQEVPPPVAEPSPVDDSAGQVVELAAGLDADEAKNYTAFLKSINVDPKSDPATWDPDRLVEVLGWLEVAP